MVYDLCVFIVWCGADEPLLRGGVAHPILKEKKKHPRTYVVTNRMHHMD